MAAASADMSPPVAEAFRLCEQMAREHYENFPVASLFLPAHRRKYVAAVYTFARTADDFADEGDRSSEERLRLLDQYEHKQLGLNDAFVGVFVVAILGNAAEHATAVTAALRNRMDLALSIAIGSSVQVALFVAPLLVLTSLFVGPTPTDLAFNGGLVLVVMLAVLITGQVAVDGRSDWLKGVQLLAVYVILGLAYFFAPAPPG